MTRLAAFVPRCLPLRLAPIVGGAVIAFSLFSTQVFAGKGPPSEGASSSTKVITILAKGIGSSANGALRDAAQNALEEVVGQFITSRTNYAKKTILINGIIKSETKHISDRISAYSQGAIRTISVIKISDKLGQYWTEAAVSVRMSFFRSSLTRLPSSSAKVPSGIFAASETNRTNRVGLYHILYASIKPLYDGSSVQYVAGKIIPYHLWTYRSSVGMWTKTVLKHGAASVIVVPVQLRVDSGYISDLLQTIRHTGHAGGTCAVTDDPPNSNSGGEDDCIPGHYNEYNPRDQELKLFVFSGRPDMSDELEHAPYGYAKSYKWILPTNMWHDLEYQFGSIHPLVVDLLGSHGDVLERQVIGSDLNSTGIVVSPNLAAGSQVWMPLADAVIYKRRRFFVLIDVRPSLQKKLRSVRVHLGKPNGVPGALGRPGIFVGAGN